MIIPESEIIGRLNGLTFRAQWSRGAKVPIKLRRGGTEFRQALNPYIQLDWKRHTEPDKFAVIADRLIAEFLESDEEDGQLDPIEDADCEIGELRLLGERGDLTLRFIEGARLAQDGKLIQQFIRGMKNMQTIGPLDSYFVDVAPFYLFSTASGGDGSGSEISVFADKFEQVINLPATIGWIRVHHPDIDSKAFRELLPDVVQRAREYYLKTEGMVGR